MGKKLLLGTLAAGAAVAVGVWTWAPWRSASREHAVTSANSARLTGTQSTMRVSAVRVAPQRLAEQLTATGTLRAEEAIELQPETNGKVVQIAFKEGSFVHRGDLLVKLNDAELRAQLTRAVFRRDLAELREQRLSKLLSTGNLRQDEYDAAVNDLNVQRSEVALVEAMIAKTEIRAPFPGIVGLRFISEGTFVTPTTKIATLQNVERVKVDFAVPEKYAARTKVGSRANFSVAGVDKMFEGEIYAADPRVDPATRTVLLRAVCANPESLLLPGSFASVAFTLSEVDGAILVPAEAVVTGVSERYVFVAEVGKAVRKAVEVGTRTEDSVHVLRGIREGEWVITSGVQQLRQGLAVTLNEGAGAGRSNPKIAEASTQSAETAAAQAGR